MAYLKIICKRPPQPKRVEGELSINGICSSLADVRVLVQRDDGVEEELRGVASVAWFGGSHTEPTQAMIEVLDVDADIETEGEIR